VRLPSSLVTDLGVFMAGRRVEVRFDVFNVGDGHYFRARTGDTLGDVIAQALPGRRWQLAVKYRF
jgi:outer membrane receptor protein involved in Fe transport